jgi:L-alanine-DL-glutamate epimerase-like enolase superfamily enzyme
MKITEIRACQIDLPLHEDSYAWADGKRVAVFDSTIAAVYTDAGLIGYGEICPLGPQYLPAYAQGARAGIGELAPHLLGADPTQIDKLNRIMDRALRGHHYVKSALDVACWDILGQAAALPICTLLGGRFGTDFGLYRAISQDRPAAMAERITEYGEAGYQAFQLKVGGQPEHDIDRIYACHDALRPGQTLIADANTGWLTHEALRVLAGVSDLDVYIEQPCLTYDECLAVRRYSKQPMVLDESIDGMTALLHALNDRAADVVNIKISKVGGLTKARRLRDVCVAQNLAVTIEDSWGGDIATAAIAHLAHSTPPKWLFSTTDFNSYVTRSVAADAPRRENGRLAAPDKPGLGLTIDPDELGKPVLCISAGSRT